MHTNITTGTEVFWKYIQAHPLEFGCREMGSLLEKLYCCYCQGNCTDPQQVRESFRKLNTILEKLSLDDQELIFHLVCQIAGAQQRKAFTDGVLTGFQLSWELHP